MVHRLINKKLNWPRLLYTYFIDSEAVEAAEDPNAGAIEDPNSTKTRKHTLQFINGKIRFRHVDLNMKPESKHAQVSKFLLDLNH